MRFGYFGGTFDPPHRGHLAVARAATEAFSLERVLFAPTGRQPLKVTAPEAEFADRFAMTRLLCNSDARFEASAIDAPHADGSPNYTVDALHALHRDVPGVEVFAIVGVDSFLTLRRWRDPDDLLALAEWTVVSRPGFKLDELQTLELSTEQRARVHLLSGVEDDTSATGLRDALRMGVTPAGRLTPEVLLYIARMQLYHAAR